MILVVCLNPTFQRTLLFWDFHYGEVNRAKEARLDASGKGANVTRVMTQMGVSATLLTHLGGSRVDEMKRLYAQDGLSVISVDGGSEMRTCTTILTPEATTELVEEPSPVAKEADGRVREAFFHALPSADAVIITGTRTPGYSRRLYADMVREAKAQGKLVVLDLKGDDLLLCLEEKPDVIKPNLSEFARTFWNKSIPEGGDDEPLKREAEDGMRRLYRLYHTSTILSRGSKDIWYWDMGFKTLSVPKAKTVNTIGCGDALAASFTAHLANGATFEEALQAATETARANAETIRPGSIQ
ncbi:MAG: PfkB family carbohydrate kinase [Sphaerochaeta sp.]|jgi:1-phosphofructokinase/tagatose 6-phosphate kinase|nr:PfkB family carbohydrate kinase [Sphaerochaeta sp.]